MRKVEGYWVSVWPSLNHVVKILVIVYSKCVLDYRMYFFIELPLFGCWDYCMLEASQSHGYARDVVKIFLSE